MRHSFVKRVGPAVTQRKVMNSDEPTDGATQSCSIGGPRCSSVSSTAADDDDDYGIPPWEYDPFGKCEQEEVEEALSEGWRRKAYRELQEKPEWRQRDIEELRNMVRGMQSIIQVETDIAPLLRAFPPIR